MTRPLSPETTAERRLHRRARLKRTVRRTVYVHVAVAFVLVVLASACYLRLVAGPVSLQDYSARVGEALAERIGPGWRVALRDANLELYGAKPAVQVSGLEIRNPGGILVLRAPHAVVSLDPVSLLTGAISPREIELKDLQVRALIGPDGSLSFLVQDEVSPAPPAPARDEAAAGTAPSPLSFAIASLLDPVLRQTSLIGALERATVTDARLTLVGPDGGERAAFSRVGARFERHDAGERRIELDLEGPHGAWQVRGNVREGAERSADLTARNVPLADLLLLTGLKTGPDVGGLKLDGRVTGRLAGGRLAQLDGSFVGTDGAIGRQGRPAVKIERTAGRASWDEGRRVLTLTDLEILSEGSQARFGGELVSHGSGGWQLRLSGRDTLVAGLTRADPAFRIDDVSADVTFGDAGVRVDRASLKGGALDMTFTGASLPGPDGTGLRARIEASGTDVRRLLRVWPDVLASDLRSFLAANLRGGVVERLDLDAALDGPNLQLALQDRPIPDSALSLAFTLRDAVLALADGLPPLRDLGVDGKLTGTLAKLTSRGGRVDLPDGRRLAFSEGSYSQADYDEKSSVARIGFRVTGGADAFAAFLRSPLLREVGAPDLDPATIRGRGDVRVTLPLTVHRIPALVDLPFSVRGTFADLSVEKLGGREKVDGGELTLNYDGGVASMKGEARISGSPATVELQVPRNGHGSATLNVTVDEAARARRGLPVGPVLAGPIVAKVVVPLGTGAKGAARIELDLTRAAVDNLVPGWAKAAGRPARASFQLVEGEATELRDLVVDSGPVQLKGHVSLAAGGALERADLSTFKLSPGDDLRVQVERAAGGYKVVLKGSVGDARPVLKWMSAGPAAKGSPREAPDVELDLAVNILTGHNDEAMTGVAARLSTRNRDLKSLQVSGRTRGGAVEARLAKRDGGDPVLTVDAGDAGAVLRFLDLYRRMVGGKLTLDARMGDAAQDGTITIDAFTLRGEPALKRLVSESVPAGTEDRNGGAAERINPNDVQFVKLTGGFRRSASRIDYRDIVIWGSQVGFNLSGSVDYGRDRTDISGTFVPAYTLNNAFSQVPIIGLILGGGRNEGLFALDFRISGQASAPTVTVNPLSAVAPGILRKLFGWMLPDGGEAPGTTGATRPGPPVER